MEHKEFEKLIEAVKVLQLRPMDKIVLKMRPILDEHQREAVRSMAKRIFPGHQVIVLDGLTDMEIVRPEAALA